MSDELIPVEDIQDYLKARNVDGSKYNDSDLKKLVDIYKDYILNLVGISLDEQEESVFDFKKDLFRVPNYLLPYYPVTLIESIQVDNEDILENQYYLDKNNGIIKWRDPNLSGELLEIKYKYQLNNEFLLNLIRNIILDMIVSSADKDSTTNLKTIKEGDISITYDTTDSTNARINTNLNNLKNYCYYMNAGS